MALEWSTDINFAGLFKRKPRAKTEYPSKTYINLIVPDEREIRGMRSIGKIVVAILVLALFAKFGVYDYFARVMEKSRELSERTDVLSGLTLQLADYDSVLETYRMYEAERMTEEAEDIPAVDVLDLTERCILPMASISSFSLKDNVLTLYLTDIELDKVGELVGNLYEERAVTGVQVTTASSANRINEKKTVALAISLRSYATADAEEASGAETAETTGEGTGQAETTSGE